MGFNMIEVVPNGSNLPQELRIVSSGGHRKVTGNLRIFFIKDGSFQVAYIPALNISAYGSDNQEAEAMIKEVLEDYFISLINSDRHQITHELSKYGWKSGFFKKRYTNEVHIDKNGVLKNFELPEDTPIEESMVETF